MDKKSIWKWLLLIVLVAGSLATVLPLGEKVRLGLDLRGGTSFVVEIDQAAIERQLREDTKEITDEQVHERLAAALGNAQERALEVIRNRVDGLGIAEPIIYPEKGDRIVVQLPGVGEAKRKEAEESIQSAAFLEFRMVHEENPSLVEKLFEKGLAPAGYEIVSREGGGMRGDYYRRNKDAVPDAKMDREFREKVGQFHAPPGYELMMEAEKVGGEILYRPYFVNRRRELSGETLKDAKVDYRSLGQPVVNLRFDSQGARKFSRVTSDYAPGGAKNPNQNSYRLMAIVMDGTLYSAPSIREPITGGRAEISGSFTHAQAALLANVLKSGALPAPVKIVERRIVDPTLGADSIRSGVSAGLYGCMAIVILMAAYYLMNGVLADLALLLNVVLLPLGMAVVAGFLGMFSAEARGGEAIALPVLTLPGIAGIALSIGMAVDANVLIFERMREEVRAGKGFMASVQAGFSKAFTAIFDSNITTIITAVIMFAVGSGPVRGYAITLIAGLIINLYTAVTVTRMFYNWIGSRKPDVGLLKMFHVIRDTSINFIGKWKVAMALSVTVILASWAIMVVHGIKDPTRVFAVDFTGGTALALSFEEKPGIEAVRTQLDKAGIPNAVIQYQKSMESGSKDLLQIKVAGASQGEHASQVLKEQFPKSGFKVMQQDDVGPQVGSELKKKAFLALALALIAMIIYIGVRFEFGFGLGAVVATFHDVLVTVGVCHLLGLQLNMTIMAAVLTIIGYSVNDTIVIFDRIREDLRLVRNRSFVEICNLGINQTLARTVLTHFYTLLSVLFLLIMGGGAIKDFSIAMFIGMISGTYSTVYIATPVVLLWYRFKTPDLGSKAA